MPYPGLLHPEPLPLQQATVHPYLHSSVQFSHSVTANSLQPMDYSTLVFPVHHQLPDLTQTHVHPVSDAIQPSHPLLPILLLPSILPSIRVCFSESVLHIRWPKDWSFSFSISPSNEYSGLISFRMDCMGAFKGKVMSQKVHLKTTRERQLP